MNTLKKILTSSVLAVLSIAATGCVDEDSYDVNPDYSLSNGRYRPDKKFCGLQVTYYGEYLEAIQTRNPDYPLYSCPAEGTGWRAWKDSGAANSYGGGVFKVLSTTSFKFSDQTGWVSFTLAPSGWLRTSAPAQTTDAHANMVPKATIGGRIEPIQ